VDGILAIPVFGCQTRIIPLSSLLKTSNNVIQKGLAFGREESGTVTVPGATRLGFLPRRLHGRGGAAVVAAMTPHQRNGGSRWQDSPIPNSSFCQRVRGAMIAALTCRQTLRAKRFARPWMSSSALGCLKRSRVGWPPAAGHGAPNAAIRLHGLDP